MVAERTEVMKVRKLVFAALVAALYVALTIASYPLAYEAVQFRVSEVLAILPFFFPFAVPGLVVGVFIANFIGPFGIIDAIVGSFATLLAATSTMIIGLKLRQYKFSKPLACFPPVIINAVIIGAMIAYFMTSSGEAESFFTAFIFSSMWVGLGQLGVMYIIGLPLMYILPKVNAIDSLNKIYGGS